MHLTQPSIAFLKKNPVFGVESDEHDVALASKLNVFLHVVKSHVVDEPKHPVQFVVQLRHLPAVLSK